MDGLQDEARQVDEGAAQQAQGVSTQVSGGEGAAAGGSGGEKAAAADEGIARARADYEAALRWQAPIQARTFAPCSKRARKARASRHAVRMPGREPAGGRPRSCTDTGWEEGRTGDRESCLGSAEDPVSTGESKLSFGGAACTRNAPCPHRASLGRRPWTKRQQASTGKPPMRMDATGQSNNGARRSSGTTCIWTARIASIIKMIGIVCQTHILAYNPRRRCLDGGTDRTDALTHLARCQHLPFLPIRHVKTTPLHPALALRPLSCCIRPDWSSRASCPHGRRGEPPIATRASKSDASGTSS